MSCVHQSLAFGTKNSALPSFADALPFATTFPPSASDIAQITVSSPLPLKSHVIVPSALRLSMFEVTKLMFESALSSLTKLIDLTDRSINVGPQSHPKTNCGILCSVLSSRLILLNLTSRTLSVSSILLRASRFSATKLLYVPPISCPLSVHWV